jgi:RNA polymerase sigma-70 factor (ECF subfamily)
MVLEAGSEEWIAQGRAAWPGFSVDAATFVHHLVAARCQLPPRHVADLYLACACAHGLPAALEALDEILTVEVARSIARTCASPAAVDDALQQLREAILVAPRGERPRIASYAGSARLTTWLTTGALRIAYRAHRRESVQGGIGPLAHALSTVMDAEVEHAKQRYRGDFEEAIRTALHELPARQRALLRLHLVEGLSLEGVGCVYNVSRATAARWLAETRGAVLAAIRRRVTERLGVGARELESLLRLVRSRLDVSLSSILASQALETF